MKELSLNVLDLAQNSITAGAENVGVEICESKRGDKLTITLTDDGRGMDAELLSRVTDPFTTTRTTRKVGMGIPLFKMAAEMADGDFSIESEPGKGTRVSACFRLSHIDRPPLGDMAGTMAALVQCAPDIDFTYKHTTDSGSFEFSTAAIRAELEGVPLSEPEVVKWIAEFIAENEAAVS